MNPQHSPLRPIFLVGMMGSGKSTVGKRLAAALGRAFVDADKELEARCGVPIATIFELEGEPGFRRRERCLIDDLTAQQGLVMATGGGAVLDPVNRALLHERGYVIYLKASAQDLWMRLRNDKARPLLRTTDPRQRIVDLVAARDALYEECAHLVVQTGRQPVERVVVEIVALLPPEFARPLADGAMPLRCTATSSPALLAEVPGAASAEAPATPPSLQD